MLQHIWISRTLVLISASKPAYNEQISQGDNMHEELKNVLTLFRERRRNLDIMKTPEIFIQQTSNPKEVEQWLDAKGFSEKTIKSLKGLTGNQIFALNKETLEDYCGAEEGRRLASQLTIQRNVSGVRFGQILYYVVLIFTDSLTIIWFQYKTTRSSELMSILAKVRQKTDAPADNNNITTTETMKV